MNLFSYAIRNIWRTRHRSGIVIAAMAFAGCIMVLYAALLQGFVQTAERNAVGMESGLYQIHTEGYRDDPDLYKKIDNADSVIATIHQQDLKAAGRLYGFGLAAAGQTSAGVKIRGLDLALESTVTEIHQHLLHGRWIDNNDPTGVVIGRKLARTLGVEVGDEIVIVGQAADGSMANDIYQVRGILKSISEGIDRGGFFMVAPAFRELFFLPTGVHEIVITGKPGQDLTVTTEKLTGLFPGLEVKNWRQLQPVVARIVDMSKSSMWIMLLITYAAVGILTLNGILMGVFDRIREFGIMKALGVSPVRVFLMIHTEALIEVSLAVIGALIIAIPLALYGETHPLDLSGLAKGSASTIAGIAIDPVWYCRLTVDSIMMPVILMLAVTVVAALYPAAKAAFISPVRAISHR